MVHEEMKPSECVQIQCVWITAHENMKLVKCVKVFGLKPVLAGRKAHLSEALMRLVLNFHYVFHYLVSLTI